MSDTTINWAVRPNNGNLTVKLFDPSGAPVIDATDVSGPKGWVSGDISVSDAGNYSFTYTWTSGYQRLVSGSVGNSLEIGGSLVDFHVEGDAASDNCQFSFSWPVTETKQRQPVTYEVSGSNIVPQADYIPAFSVLGADVQRGGSGADIPVTMEVRAAGVSRSFQPFGPYNNPETGAINSDSVGVSQRAHINQSLAAQTAFSVTVQAWRNQNGIMQPGVSVNSGSQLKILQPGDPIPQIPGAKDQPSIQEFLDAAKLSDGTNTKLRPNQAILCYEFSSNTSSNNWAADFQDALLLVTLFPANANAS